jgi:hypothetical protein
MDMSEAEALLLRRLYEAWSSGNGTELVDIGEWSTEAEVDWKLARRAFEKLNEAGFLETMAMGSRVRLTARGVIKAESENHTPSDLSDRNRVVRERILCFCLGDEEEKPRVKWETLSEKTGEQNGELDRNAMLLSNLGLGGWPVSGYFQLTSAGAKVALRTRALRTRAERFEQLKSGSELTPQQRGHQVEVLLDQVLVGEDWATERNVRAPGEEQDLVVNQGRDYYLLESRWLAAPVEASDVREFYARVTARHGVGGLFFSMSGFTSGSVEWARDRLESCMMLFFGPRDIEGLMVGAKRFSDLLANKLHAAITRRRISIDEG